MNTILYWLVRLLFGFRAYNTEVLKTKGPVLLLPNHVSWWDWMLLGVCLEDDWRFVTSSATAQLTWVHHKIMVNRRTFPIDMNSPYAVKHIAEYLQKGGRLVMFPEGRLSTSGSLMKLFDGTGFLMFKTHAKVITAYLRRAQRLPLSPNPNRKEWFPRVSAHFSEAWAPPGFPELSATQARSRLTDWLRDRMMRQQFETEMEFGPATLPGAIAVAAQRWPKQVALQDVTMQKVTYRRLLVGAELLAERWRALFGEGEERVGVLLPNVNAMPVVLLSLWATRKVPAILNYTTGAAIMQSCAGLAGLKRIITSRSFVTQAKLDIEPLKAGGIEFLFLEDVRAGISGARKFGVMLGSLFGSPLAIPQQRTEDTAFILFTSGSEGVPKGVELSHRNVLANVRQMVSVIDLMDTDRFFNALPLFHSFGLTIGLLLPLIQGNFVFLYLSPLHYRVVPSAFYNLDCTVFFGTNTFLSGYGRKANPFDFRKVRYLFAGAEKLQEATAQLWMNKFGVRVLEGYGATECSPCLSANLPIQPRGGSVGRFLPAIEHRLEKVEGIEETPNFKPQTSKKVQASGDSAGVKARQNISGTGRLFVKGPNVMKGYLNAEANAKFQALEGWYDTGDIARVDDEGFVYILGRLKRFAKVSGEMVSLTAVEDALAGAFPHYGLKFAVAVIARPDEAKGEKLIAVTNESRLTLEEMREAVKKRGLMNIAVPREIKVVHDIPRLGTGKVNHRELEKMA
jgi:acyl-[acyl-carrier-protein]-phospholipid O-acyltransferase/long-chain-fatty-acid--[acyl-carrier-protein] ligase